LQVARHLGIYLSYIHAVELRNHVAGQARLALGAGEGILLTAHHRTSQEMLAGLTSRAGGGMSRPGLEFMGCEQFLSHGAAGERL